MASSNELARLVIKLEAQTAAYDATLKRVSRDLRKFRSDTNTALSGIQKQFSAFGQSLMRSFAIGSVTAALYGLTASVKDAVKAGDDLAKFASKTGLSAKAVSELAYAAKQADIDLGGLETGIKKMQVSISNLGSGSKTQVETFAALGLTFRDLKDLQPDQQLELIAEQISKLKDPADRTRAAVELFGKAGADLLPLFEQGAEGIQKLRAETPHVFSEEDLKRLSDADDAVKRLNSSMDGLWASIATKLAPVITKLADDFTRLLQGDFTSSSFFRLLTTPPPLWFASLPKIIRGAVSSGPGKSGPMGRVLPGLATGDEPPGFKPNKIAAMQPVLVTATKIQEAFWESLQRTGTAAEQAQAKYIEFMAALQTELAKGTIDAAKFNERLDEYIQSQLELGKVAKEHITIASEGFEQIRIVAQRAAESIQDAFAQFFMDFGKSSKDMARNFLLAIKQMAAQLFASGILQALGGKLSGSSNSLVAALGSAFLIPGRASGGPVMGGKPYMVGETGPELFVPGSAGNIVPGGAGAVYAPVMTFNIDSRSDRATILRDINSIVQENSRQMVQFLSDQQSRPGAFGRV